MSELSDDILRIASFTDESSGVIVAGEIDLFTSSQLYGALEQFPTDRRVLVDMSGVTFMDSTGISVLLRHAQRFSRDGGALRVRDPSRAVERLLKIAGLAELLEHQHS